MRYQPSRWFTNPYNPVGDDGNQWKPTTSSSSEPVQWSLNYFHFSALDPAPAAALSGGPASHFSVIAHPFSTFDPINLYILGCKWCRRTSRVSQSIQNWMPKWDELRHGRVSVLSGALERLWGGDIQSISSSRQTIIHCGITGWWC